MNGRAVNGGLFAGVSPLIPDFDPGPFRVYPVDDQVALTLVSRVLHYFSVSIIPITHHSRLRPNGT